MQDDDSYGPSSHSHTIILLLIVGRQSLPNVRATWSIFACPFRVGGFPEPVAPHYGEGIGKPK